MDTIVIDSKRFVIRKYDNYMCCHKCLFYFRNNYPNSRHYCRKTKCDCFIVIREVNVIDKIRIWLKKKIKI